MELPGIKLAISLFTKLNIFYGYTPCLIHICDDQSRSDMHNPGHYMHNPGQCAQSWTLPAHPPRGASVTKTCLYLSSSARAGGCREAGPSAPLDAEGVAGGASGAASSAAAAAPTHARPRRRPRMAQHSDSRTARARRGGGSHYAKLPTMQRMCNDTFFHFDQQLNIVGRDRCNNRLPPVCVPMPANPTLGDGAARRTRTAQRCALER